MQILITNPSNLSWNRLQIKQMINLKRKLM